MVAVPVDRYRWERLYQQDRLELPAGAMTAGDEVVLAAPDAGGAVVFGVARVLAAPPRPDTDPVPAGDGAAHTAAGGNVGNAEVGDEARDAAAGGGAGDAAAGGGVGDALDGGTATASGSAGGVVLAEYVRRLVDRPVPVDEAGCGDLVEPAARGPVPLPAERYERLLERIGPAPDPVAPKQSWMVSLDLPIEAASAAEAVRVFWTYVRQLGPAELPVFVSPRGDELAMRPYVLGAEHEMDPEEE